MGTDLATSMVPTGYVALACMIAAVALAAPTPDFLEEDAVLAESSHSEAVSGDENPMSMLEASQTNTGELSTHTITNLLNMIRDKSEPAIKIAHAQDQSILNSKMNAVEIITSGAEDIFMRLEARRSKLRASIAQHNTLAEQWRILAGAYDDSIGDYERIVKDKTSTCCKEQQLAIPALEYQPSYSMCDFKKHSSDECVQEAIKQVKSHVEYRFAEGAKEYESSKSHCSSQALKVGQSLSVYSNNHAICLAKAKETDAIQSIVSNDKPILKQDWSRELRKYRREHTTELREYTSAAAQVRARVGDRRDQWDALQKQMCMLEKLKAGKDVDDKALRRCKEQISHEHLVIHYPKTVLRAKYVLGPFSTMTKTNVYTRQCNKKEHAKEDADKECKLRKSQPKPVCKHHTPVAEHSNPFDHGKRWPHGACTRDGHDQNSGVVKIGEGVIGERACGDMCREYKDKPWSGCEVVASKGSLAGCYVHTSPVDGTTSKNNGHSCLLKTVYDTRGKVIKKYESRTEHKIVHVASSNATLIVDPINAPVRGKLGGKLYSDLVQ